MRLFRRKPYCYEVVDLVGGNTIASTRDLAEAEAILAECQEMHGHVALIAFNRLGLAVAP